MIKVDKVEDGLPISVIVPLSNKRKSFFHEFVLPMIEANNPIEIIINDNEGTAPKKRNDGFKKATQPFVFFCDDDIVLPASYLQTLYNALKNGNNAGYAYTGYYGIAKNPNVEPNHNFVIESQVFSATVLRQYNYISTMALIRKESFIGFDETLKRFQDWSMWLSMLEQGKIGIFVPDIKFIAFFNDAGITSNQTSYVDAYNIIKIKHNL
jgi:glycosyltransferase involved in cell wall biosynthesis